MVSTARTTAHTTAGRDSRLDDRLVVRRPWHGQRRLLIGVATTALAALAVGWAPLASQAAPVGEIGVFPSWTVTGTSGAYSATAAFPASAAFPTTTVTSTSTTAKAPTGESAWLGSSTTFGQEFGSTRSQPYLYLSTAAGQANSVTTITFDAAPPADWGFALGDVDADWVYVQAWADAARTVPVSVADLGFRDAANYCNNSPKPSTCVTPPFTDAPVWVTAQEDFDGFTYYPSTLRGNSLPGNPSPTRDTAGAYGWFQPTTTIRSIDLTFGRRDGFPVYQLWLAALAPSTTITGSVVIPGSPEGVPPGTVAQLNDTDGSPVLDIEDRPVTVPVDPNGSYVVESEQRESYQIAVLPPPGFQAPDPITVPADTASVVAPPITLAPTVVVPPSQPTAGGVAPVAPTPSLAATGFDVAALAPLGILAGAVGLLLYGIVKTRARREN